MTAFLQHMQTLRDHLDDLILYLEQSGQGDKAVRQLRQHMDDDDPFVQVQASLIAQAICSVSHRTVH